MTGLIIDDDPLVVQTIDHFVEKSALAESCSHAGDVATAVNLLAVSPFDFVLLDLHLPDSPGESALSAIPATTPVIVVSSDPGFGAASYSHPNIVDYLVKPIDYVGFNRALQRASSFRSSGAPRTPAPPSEPSGQVIFVKSGSEVVRVALDEVRYIKAEANYVCFHFGPDTRPVMALASLKKIIGQLPAGFLRTHRSYVVNRAHILRFDGSAAHLAEASIPVGDAFRAEFLNKLGIVA